jgi:hypothetical protein
MQKTGECNKIYMKKSRKKVILSILITECLILGLLPTQFLVGAAGETGPSTNSPQTSSANASIYIPLVIFGAVPAPPTQVSRVNAPYFNVSDLNDDPFSEMAIFWFGKVTTKDNYTDVRVGYNNSGLHMNLASFDRYLWYDSTPSTSDLTNWDSYTLYLNTSSNGAASPNSTSYRFDAQLNWWEGREDYQAVYRGNGTGWSLASIPFTTISGWRGNAPNDAIDDRGFSMTFFIPYSSLGLSGPPPSDTVWRMAVVSHDRDDAAGTLIADKTWPRNMDTNKPSTWGQLHFGLSAFTPPTVTPIGTITIRHQLNGAIVPDAAVGGTTGNLCPGDASYIWDGWGNENYAGSDGFNIQNQGDVADWPCFAKYYVTFPLSAIPVGKVLVSASLVLHQWGNSGPYDLVQPSYVQVSTVNEDWNEATLTWDNSPMALENVSQAWVPKVDCFGPGGSSWPCTPRTWDVSQAVIEAYNSGNPLRLVLYSSDSAQHSGKFFTSSDVGDWDEVGRPTLTVTWGNP